MECEKMNQKDYKAIAEIINQDTRTDIKTSDNKEMIDKELFILDLADYFEKEDKIIIPRSSEHSLIDCSNKKFDKQQFLKDCGVEE